MKKLGDLMMILDLHRQGLKVAVIARQTGIDRKTVRKYIARGLEMPTYGPRQPRDCLLDSWLDYLRARLEAYPGLSARRLLREISERGYSQVVLQDHSETSNFAVISAEQAHSRPFYQDEEPTLQPLHHLHIAPTPGAASCAGRAAWSADRRAGPCREWCAPAQLQPPAPEPRASSRPPSR